MSVMLTSLAVIYPGISDPIMVVLLSLCIGLVGLAIYRSKRR